MMPNRKTAEHEHKNRPNQEISSSNLGQPQPSKQSGDSKKSAKTNASNTSVGNTMRPRSLFNSNCCVIKEKRPRVRPTMSHSAGGRGQLSSLIQRAVDARLVKMRHKSLANCYDHHQRRGRRLVRLVPLDDTIRVTHQLVKPSASLADVVQLVKPEPPPPDSSVPQPRLVGIELNPGPGKLGPKGKKIVKAMLSKSKKGTMVALVKGKGDYTLPSREPGKLAQYGGQSWGRAAGEALGNFSSLPFAKSALGWVGDKAHGIFKKIFGWGDYATRSAMLHQHMQAANHHPTALKQLVHTVGSQILTGNPPQFSSDSDGTVICHREYIGPVYGSTAFTSTSYPINPGLIQSYPWLGTVAPAYLQYEVLGQVYEYSSSSDIIVGSNTAAGKVYLTTQYNPTLVPFNTEISVANNEYTTSEKPENSFYHLVECNPRESQTRVFNVRSGSLPTNADLRLSDLGYLQVVCTGMQATGGHVGDLWVTYRIRLLKPTIPVASANYGAYCHLSGIQAQSVSNNNGMLTSPTTAPSSTMVPLGYNYSTSQTGIYFNNPQPGNYAAVYCTLGGGNTYTTNISFSYPTGTSPLNICNGDTQSNFAANGSTTSSGPSFTTFCQFFKVVTGYPTGTWQIAINGVSTGTNNFNADFFIVQIPGGALTLPSNMVEDPTTREQRLAVESMKRELSVLRKTLSSFGLFAEDTPSSSSSSSSSSVAPPPLLARRLEVPAVVDEEDEGSPGVLVKHTKPVLALVQGSSLNGQVSYGRSLPQSNGHC